MSYLLSADLFTQDVFEDSGHRYLDTLTRALAVDAGFTSKGVPVLSGDDVLEYDLNGDGKTNRQDAGLPAGVSAGQRNRAESRWRHER